MKADAIAAWAEEFRQQSDGPFQVNLWIPDPAPVRDEKAEERQRDFLSSWGPAATAEMGDAVLPDFQAQCEAILAVRPVAVSSIMGIFPPDFVAEMKSRDIFWLATATTVPEARAAEAAGADVIVAQGMEAGGHRGAFDAAKAETESIGLIALLPQICDAVSVPVIAAGGIADGRGVAAALILGASAVQIGPGFLRAQEAKIPSAYRERLGRTEAQDTRLTRAFSGRAGRSVRTHYVEAAAAADAPPPAPYPVQRGFTRLMREEAVRSNDPERMQMWAGQAARFARPEPAGVIVQELWGDARQYLR
jgi:nitronate monooxygenase